MATACAGHSYLQEEVLEYFGVTDPRMRGLFLNGGIERRNLTLPPRGPDRVPVTESQGELLRKHTAQGTAMGGQALREVIAQAGLALEDVGYLCCVTTTGLVTPGFSALLIKELGLPVTCSRLDVVGMGCNAGLNAMTAVAGWSSANPGKVAVLLCVETCSAAYVFDGTMRTAVVNSLFGDGAAALVLRTPVEDDTEGAPVTSGPALVRFRSRIMPAAIEAMRYDWSDDAGKFSFYLDPDIPYLVGANVEAAVADLLAGTGIHVVDVAHWVVHSGGKKVIDSLRYNLGLSRHDLRHTLTVLRDHGNLSSGAFLFSYGRLVAEGTVEPGDVGVMITMGPGSTIETALLQW